MFGNLLEQLDPSVASDLVGARFGTLLTDWRSTHSGKPLTRLAHIASIAGLATQAALDALAPEVPGLATADIVTHVVTGILSRAVATQTPPA